MRVSNFCIERGFRFFHCRTSKKAVKGSQPTGSMSMVSTQSAFSGAPPWMAMMLQLMNAYQQQSQGEPASSSRAGKRPLAITYPQSSGQPLALGDLQEKPADKPAEQTAEKPADNPADKPLIEMPPASIQKESDDGKSKDNMSKGKSMTAAEQAGLVSGQKQKKGMKKPAAAPTASTALMKKPAGPTKVKPCKVRPAKGGWQIEERTRDNGGVDKYYVSPEGASFRTKREAIEHGYSE